MSKLFRDYLPFHISTVETPVVVTADDPTWTTFNTLTISDNLPAGTYMLMFSWTWAMADFNDSALFRITSPITSGNPFRYEPNDANEFRGNTGIAPQEYGGGPITFAFEASKTSGAQDLTIAASYLVFERKV